LNPGRCLQIGTPAEIYARPATQFVAGFVGSPRMSFVPVTAERRDGTVRLRAGDTVIGLGAGAAAVQWPASVAMGVRPEDVVLVAAGTGDLDARVDLVESFGRESLVHLLHDSPDGSHAVRALVAGQAAAAPGDRVGVRFPVGKLHLFDAATGARITLSGT
jgi:ABC-type sugar transport system ATPase subunit